MKLAFSGEARYADFNDGYALYVKRAKTDDYMDLSSYKKVIRSYCKALAERLCDEGMIDFPCGVGSIFAVEITRRPQYRGKKFIGYGKMDWDKGCFDGSPKAFGLTFLPTIRRKNNLRCYGFVANRKLFKKVKEQSQSYFCQWRLLPFSDEMI